MEDPTSDVMGGTEPSEAIQKPRVAVPLTPDQEKRISRWGALRQKLVRRCFQGRVSPRTAIRLQCMDCCGEDYEAGKGCGDRCCPLWHFRPGKGAQ